MKVWITKYALSQGIFAVEGDPVGDGLFRPAGEWHHYHGEGKEWHRTLESAVARAEEMRKAKIASLAKQIRKLDKLTFSTDD